MRARVLSRRRRWLSIVPIVGLLCSGVSPVAAESNHWGPGVARLTLSSGNLRLATEPPRRSSWTFGPDTAIIGVWHRDAEVSAGPATVFGSLEGRRENSLGGVGTAAFTFPTPVAGRPFTVDVSGGFIRVKSLFQVELSGTASDGNGEVVPIRMTGSGPWRPTVGDGILAPTTEAEVVLSFTFIFPGNTPPPPGPKAASALDFAGTASLPTFPCPPPGPGELPCVGSFAGNIEAFFAGDAGAGSFALDLVSPFTALFSYADLLQPGAPCAEGLATGSGTVGAGPNEVFGYWTNQLGELQIIKRAEVTFSFDWRREGLTAVLVLRDLSIRVRGEGVQWTQVVDPGSSTGPATAVFIPNLTQEHLEACELGQPGPPITAEVNGTGTIDGF